MKPDPTSPLFWWSGRTAASPPVAPATTGRAMPRISTINPIVWWVRQRGSSPGPPAASEGFPRPWLGLSSPLVVWNYFLPRVGGTTDPGDTYVVGPVYPNAMAASSRFAGDGADPWASTTSTAATIADPSAASSRKLGNRP